MCSVDVQAMEEAGFRPANNALVCLHELISIILYSSDFPGLFQSLDFSIGCLLLIRRNQTG
jgi:hypothetical protein